MERYANPAFKIAAIAFAVFMFFDGGKVSAQETEVPPVPSTKFNLHEKGRFFFTWGYNRAWFEESDIHLTGQGHDFILYDVKAADRPSPLSIAYVSPSQWSVPQFNFRMGYFVSDKYSVSVGWDHMKYVAQDYQMVRMYGSVFPSMAIDTLMKRNMEKFNAKYEADGLYNDTLIQMTPDDFLRYEHTDGFNSATVDFERYDKLWQHAKYDKLGITLVTGAGIGIIVPRTDAHLFGSGSNHFWNIAGWGTNAKVGVQVSFFKHFYLESNFKVGYVQMINVHTTNHYNIDKAQQNIVFYETNVVLGYTF